MFYCWLCQRNPTFTFITLSLSHILSPLLTLCGSLPYAKSFALSVSFHPRLKVRLPDHDSHDAPENLSNSWWNRQQHQSRLARHLKALAKGDSDEQSVGLGQVWSGESMMIISYQITLHNYNFYESVTPFSVQGDVLRLCEKMAQVF